MLLQISVTTKIDLVWVPGHAGIEGNEKVDKVAKNACKQDQQSIPISLQVSKAVSKNHLKTQWRRGIRNDLHKSITGGRSPNKVIHESMSRLQAIALD